MKRRKLFLPLFYLGLIIIMTYCHPQRQEENNTKDVKVKINTTRAKLQMVDKISTYTAYIQADIVNQITPAFSGRIEKIYVEIGENVSKGQLLVQMESSNLQQQQIQLTRLERDYDRYNELFKVGGVSQQQLEQMKTQMDILRAAIKNIRENTQLRSPICGTVTARNYDNGNMTVQMPILTVQQLNPLKAIINVSESEFAKVKVGMLVDVKLDVYGEEKFKGKVRLIHPVIDISTHTFGVEITIDNKNLRVRPGMYALVSLNFGAVQSIILPDVAVQKQAGSNDKYVYIIENNQAVYKKVILGKHQGNEYEILSGIQAGQQVVTAGQTRLTDGQSVEVIYSE